MSSSNSNIPSTNELLKISSIGSGAYGTVYRTLPINEGNNKWTSVAVKRNIISQSISFVGCIREIDMLKRFSGHQHFVRFIKTTTNVSIATTPTQLRAVRDDILYPMIEEYSTSMDHYLANHKLNTDQVLHVLCQLLLALEYMHSKNIMHRDLKPSNILVDKTKLQVYIGDFGMASPDNGEPHTPDIIPFWYKAPEVLSSKYNTLVDMWSFGCIAYELITGEVLIMANSQEELIAKYKLLDDNLSRYLLSVPQEIRPFVEKTVCPSSVRLTATELLNKYFRNNTKLKTYIHRVRERFPPTNSPYPEITYINPEIMSHINMISENSNKYIWYSPRILLLALDLSTRVLDEDTPAYLYTMHLLYISYKYYLTLGTAIPFSVFCSPLIKTLRDQEEIDASNGAAIETTVLSYLNYEIYRRSFFSAFMTANVEPSSHDVIGLCNYMLDVCTDTSNYTSEELVLNYIDISSK
jgi:serine/threonine protein kinase